MIIALIVFLVLLVGIVLLGFFFRRKIIKYLTVPRLLVSPWFAEAVAQWLGDELLLDLLLLKSNTIEHYGSIYSIPIALVSGELPEDLGNLKQLKTNSYVAYFYKNLILIEFEPTRLKQGTLLLYDLWDGNNPRGLCLFGQKATTDNPQVQDFVEYVYRCCGLELAVMIFWNGGVNVGFEPGERHTIAGQLDKLALQWQNSLFYSNQLNAGPLVDFYRNREKIRLFLLNLKELHCKVAGVYAVDGSQSWKFNKISSLCSHGVMGSSPGSLLLYISYALGGLVLIFVCYRSWGLVKKARIIKEYASFVQQSDSQLLSLPNLDQNLYVCGNPMVALFAHKKNRIIKRAQQELLLGKPLPEPESSSSYNFRSSPFNTRFAHQITREIYNLLGFAKDLKLLDQTSEQTWHRYEQIQAKIMKLINKLVEHFHHHQLINNIDKLRESLDNLQQNANIKDLSRVLDLIRQVENSCSLDNKWWRQKKLGNNYKTLMSRLKGHRFFGDSLASEVEEQFQRALEEINNKAIHSEHHLCGSILVANDEGLRLSNDLKQFYKQLRDFLNDPIFEVFKTNNPEPQPMENQFISWDVSELTKIHKEQNKNFVDICQSIGQLPKSLELILRKIAAQSMCERHNNILLRSYELVNNLKPKDALQNMDASFNILNNIDAFFNSELGETPEFIKKSIHYNSELLAKKICEIIHNSEISAYEKLPRWSGEPLVSFLFQIPEHQLMEKLDGLYTKWLGLKVFAELLIKYLPRNHPLVAFFSYFLAQLKGISSPHNQLKRFIQYMMELKNWEIKWREITTNQVPPREFFRYEMEKFRRELENRTNELTLERSCRNYKLIRKEFYKLGNRFPFGHGGGDAPIENMIRFVGILKEYMHSILQDQGFKKAYPEQYKTIDGLRFFAESIQINGGRIFFNLNMQYHLDINGNSNPRGNANHILRYRTLLGTIGKTGDNFPPLAVELNSPVELFVSYLDGPTTPGATQQQQFHRFSFPINFGLLKFIRAHYYRRIGRDVILRFDIHTTRPENNITVYAKVFNFPEFPEKMPELL
jgi:hypothetical protein